VGLDTNLYRDTLGWWFKWITYINPMKYGFVALVKNEFTGLTLTCTPGSDSSCPSSGAFSGNVVITVIAFL
jgi:ABC-type multidrug transport system permease subunit